MKNFFKILAIIPIVVQTIVAIIEIIEEKDLQN
jgi:hypothetical protein